MRGTELQPILVLEGCDEDFATLSEVLLERGAPNSVHRSTDSFGLAADGTAFAKSTNDLSLSYS